MEGRRRSDLRDRLFYIGVALVFAATGAALAAVAPVIGYDCGRHAAASVNCTVRPRVYGVVPLPPRTCLGVRSVHVETSSQRTGSISSWIHQTYEVLVLACADGTEWRSFASTAPLGQSNSAIASGIQDLLSADAPREFHAWTGEKVPLLVGTVFLLPLMLIVLALLLRFLLFRGQKAEEATAALRVVAERRREAAAGWMSAGAPCPTAGCTGVMSEQGICEKCGTPAPKEADR